MQQDKLGYTHLLRAESVRSNYLYSQGSGVHESHGVERDLTNHSVVWHHHGHRTEEHFQVVWQLRPSCKI